MRRHLLVLATLALAAYSPAVAIRAQSAAPSALGGQVTSVEEGAMEGVLVTARKAGASMATTVVSDASGRYAFPRTRLAPGAYTITMRAAGYDLAAPVAATIDVSRTATADLTLQKTKNLSAQLTNAEWLASFPGTDAQKADIRGCAHCHTLELITKSRHDVNEFMAVVERMSGYPPLAFPLMPQRTPAPRVGGGEIPRERQLQIWRRQAEYLATLNHSAGPDLGYTLKTQPRPSGAATRAVYTEYDLPQRTRQPHDVIVDAQGMVWYASFGEQILGKMDPRTGKVTEYQIPILKPDAPKGILGMRFDRDENPWLAMQFQGGIARFDRKTETFQTWSLPPEMNGPHVQVNQVSPERSYVDGKVWLQDAGTYDVMRLDIASGTFERFEPYSVPRPNVYDVIPDSRNNGYFLTMGAEEVGRIDANTGAIDIFKTPTKGSGPRRGMMDSQDRLWFGENRSDKIGMFDTKTRTFQEWTPTPGAWPYDVTLDRNGEAWAGGEYNDRILRLNPKTGAFIEYLMPGHTNVRRVWVDNTTTPVTFWVGSNHAASIVKLETPDDRPAGAVAAAAQGGRKATYNPMAHFEVTARDVELRRSSTGRQLMARVYQPQGPGLFPTILDLHGGAWNRKNRMAEEPMDRALAASGLLVVAIDMTLAPDAPYPAAVQDANYAVRWLKWKAASWYGDPSRIGIYASSSGGHVAELLVMRPRDPRYNALPLPEAPNVDATVAFVAMRSPISNPFARFQNAELLKRDEMMENHTTFFKPWETIHESNPQEILERGEKVDLAPLLIMQGALDDNVLPAVQERFARAYRAAGGDCQYELFADSVHEWVATPGPQTDRARDMVKAFIARQFGP